MSQIRVKINHSRLAYNGQRMYVARPIRYTCISTDELVRYASENHQISQAALHAALCAIQESMEELICNGHSVELGSIGTFRHSFSSHAGRQRSEISADDITRRRIIYLPSKHMKSKLADIRYVGFESSAAQPDSDVSDEDE